MPRDPKFYIRSEPFWGYPPRRWAVYDRESTKPISRKSKFFEDSRDADKLCKRMNADWDRYIAAMAEKRSSNG